MPNKVTVIIMMISLAFFASCEDVFDYSPYAIDFDEADRGVNEKSITKILSSTNDSIISIAFTGDTHNHFDELEAFVNSVNTIHKVNPIDFVVHVGDIADFGLPQQYVWGNSYLQKLDMPYIVLIGNHDLVGNGSEAYAEMFGLFNFHFVFDSTKFIFINTNSLEYEFNGKVPDISWLDYQLQPENNFTDAVVMFHVPPLSVDFDANLEEQFHTTIAKYDNVLFTVHGHLHHHEVYTPYNDSINYVNVYGVGNEKYNIINITKTKFDVQEVCF